MEKIFWFIFPELYARHERFNLLIAIGRGMDFAYEDAYGKIGHLIVDK